MREGLEAEQLFRVQGTVGPIVLGVALAAATRGVGRVDETAARVSAELRPGVWGGGRSRDQLVRHVMATEGGDFSKRVKAKSDAAVYGARPIRFSCIIRSPITRIEQHLAVHELHVVEREPKGLVTWLPAAPGT